MTDHPPRRTLSELKGAAGLSRRTVLAGGMGLMGSLAMGQAVASSVVKRNQQDVPWDVAHLRNPPRVYPAEPELQVDGLSAIYFDGLPYRGQDTRVFAYYGIPERTGAGLAPAALCAHGGGGTAFAQWVRLWNERGYAALAMDLEGHVPLGERPHWQSHPWAGPSRVGIFRDYREPVSDQWMYHAVADVVLGHSLLRSLPGVHPDRVGLHGISWGGLIAAVVAGLDHRFRFIMPVYGCGWVYDQPNWWGDAFDAMGEYRGDVIDHYDPSRYLPYARAPMLWVTGANDRNFHLSIFSRSYTAVRSNVPASVLSVQQGLRHSHPLGWSADELYAFADSVVERGEPLNNLGPTVASAGHIARANVDRPEAVRRARLLWTTDSWQRDTTAWQPVDARLVRDEVMAPLPAAANAWYFEVVDDRDLVTTNAVEPPAVRPR